MGEGFELYNVVVVVVLRDVVRFHGWVDTYLRYLSQCEVLNCIVPNDVLMTKGARRDYPHVLSVFLVACLPCLPCLCVLVCLTACLLSVACCLLPILTLSRSPCWFYIPYSLG